VSSVQSSPVRSFFVVALLGVTLATIAIVVRSGIFARKNPGEPINSAMREAMGTPQLSVQDALLIDRDYSTAHRLKSGLRYVVHSPGEGEPVHVGAHVKVNYVGRFLNGVEFERSSTNNRPIEGTVGTGEIPVKGLDEGILGMKKGEKRTLIVPYWLGYGIFAHGTVPPRATLVYDVELVDFE